MDIQPLIKKTEFTPITITLNTREEALDFLAIMGHVQPGEPYEGGVRDAPDTCDFLQRLLGLNDSEALIVYKRIKGGELAWT